MVERAAGVGEPSSIESDKREPTQELATVVGVEHGVRRRALAGKVVPFRVATAHGNLGPTVRERRIVAAGEVWANWPTLAEVLKAPAAAHISERSARRVCFAVLNKRIPPLAVRGKGDVWRVSGEARLDGVNSVESLMRGLKVRDTIQGVTVGGDPTTPSPMAQEKIRNTIAVEVEARAWCKANGEDNFKRGWKRWRVTKPGGKAGFRENRTPWSFNDHQDWITRRIPKWVDVEEGRGSFAKT